MPSLVAATGCGCVRSVPPARVWRPLPCTSPWSCLQLLHQNPVDSMAGNLFTMAPERLETGLTEKSDVFALAVLCGRMVQECVRVPGGPGEPDRPFVSCKDLPLHERTTMVASAALRLDSAGAPAAVGVALVAAAVVSEKDRIDSLELSQRLSTVELSAAAVDHAVAPPGREAVRRREWGQWGQGRVCPSTPTVTEHRLWCCVEVLTCSPGWWVFRIHGVISSWARAGTPHAPS
jgi:hypothetical protein